MGCGNNLANKLPKFDSLNFAVPNGNYNNFLYVNDKNQKIVPTSKDLHRNQETGSG
jgi:hypothetical protein